MSASAINSTSLLASWMPPQRSQQNGIIRQYRIILTESETGVITYYTIQNSLQTTLTDLHPYYNYQVTVAAITIGLGPYSTEATVQLPEAGLIIINVFLNKIDDLHLTEPSGSPNNFTTQVAIIPTANLTWSPIEDDEQNGDLRGYRVNCISIGSSTIAVEVIGTSMLLTDHDGLQADTHYTCTVCAFTSVGCGPNSTDHFSTYENCKLMNTLTCF